MKRYVLLVVVIGCLTTALFAGAGSKNFPKLAFYERFVAIDNACGWPNLTLLPSGQLACVIWPHPNHGITEGAVECWLSSDGGKSWKRVGVPVPAAPTTNRMNVAAGLATDGSFVTLVGGWDKRQQSNWTMDPLDTRSAAIFFVGAKPLFPIPAVSTDDGRTWKQFRAVEPLQPGGAGIIPYGRIAPLCRVR